MVEVKKQEISTLDAQRKLAEKSKQEAEVAAFEAEKKDAERHKQFLERRVSLHQAEKDAAKARKSLAEATQKALELELQLANRRGERDRTAGTDAAVAMRHENVIRELERKVLEALRTAAEREKQVADKHQDIAKRRLELYQAELASAYTIDEWFAIAMSVAGSAAGFAKGLLSSSALSMRPAYPFCDSDLRDWVYREVPRELLVDPITRANKVLVRDHIATRFEKLPYVSRKGSFRFDLRGLARTRFDHVHGLAHDVRHVLPGAERWLERNRGRLDNKYHASKFYLLAVVMPWIAHHGKGD